MLVVENMYISEIYQKLKFAIYEPDYAFYSVKSKILNLFGRKIKPPKKIVFLLVVRCNLSCSMCALGENLNKRTLSPSLLDEEILLDDIKSIVDFARSVNSSIWLTGGEPLLHTQWSKIAEYIKKKKLRCYLQTNGILLEKYKNEIIEYIDFLNVSVDGTPTTHDVVRGRKDAFNRILSGLELIDEEKKKKSRKKPYINICYTVTPENYTSVDELIKILQESKIDIAGFNFQHLEFVNSALLEKYKKRFEKEGKNKDMLEIFLQNNTYIDTEYLIQKIKELKHKKLNFNVTFSPDISFEDIKEYYHNPEYISKKIFRKCKRPYEEVFIHPSGEVWTCPSINIGNIKEEKFENIWEKFISKISKNKDTVCNDCLGELYMYHRIVLYLMEKIK